jgi:chromosome segregation ATPase
MASSPEGTTPSPLSNTSPTPPVAHSHDWTVDWKKHLISGLVSVVIAITTALVTTLATLHTSTALLEDRIKTATSEINTLRDKVGTLETDLANHSNLIFSSNGKLETAVNQHSLNLAALKVETSNLGKSTSQLFGQHQSYDRDETWVRNQLDKISSDLTSVREKLAVVDGHQRASK